MGYMGAFNGDQVTGYLLEWYNWESALHFWAGCSILAAVVVAALWRVGPRRDEVLEERKPGGE